MNNCSRHAAQKYLPEPQRGRGLALCLSGVGLRAALFHVGAIGRLNELGILSRVASISAVGGGSVIAGLLAVSWYNLDADDQGVFRKFDERVREPVELLASHPMRLSGFSFESLRPSSWSKMRRGEYGQADRLAACLDRRLYRRSLLCQLPTEPELIVTATNLRTGSCWEFRPRRMGECYLGYTDTDGVRLAEAVAASLAPPAELPPLQLRLASNAFEGGLMGPKANPLRRCAALLDGNMGDCLAVEPVWRSASTLICSDGGTRPEFAPKYRDWLGNRLVRAWEITQAAAFEGRKRWLVSNLIHGSLTGSYISLSAYHGHYGLSGSLGYPRDVVEEIRRIHTGLSPFSQRQVMTLVNHGYSLADTAIRRNLPHLINGSASLALPYPDFVDRSKVLEGLDDVRRQAA